MPCEICGKLVKNKHTLKSHVKLVHGKGGSEFPCDKCGKIFKSKGSLKYHSMVHTGEYKFRSGYEIIYITFTYTALSLTAPDFFCFVLYLFFSKQY